MEAVIFKLFLPGVVALVALFVFEGVRAAIVAVIRWIGELML